MSNFSYENSGVDINTANRTKEEMRAILETSEKRVLNRLGAFASLYDIEFPAFRHPVLVLKTEEPGSKQLLAFQHDKIEGVCYDMINHLINDCIVMGAIPLSVQDCIVCGRLEQDKVKRIVKGIAAACREQGCVLTGGETSEQPGVIPAGTYILTSSIVGIAEKEDIIDGSAIREGDIVLGLASSGLHTNGYSLVRKLLKEIPGLESSMVGNRTFIEEILTPHRCYYNTVKGLFGKNLVQGMAHITGGGIRENLNRILPVTLNAEIVLDHYRVLPVFRAIREAGSLQDVEMLRTFNLGVGMAVVVKKEYSRDIIQYVKERNVECYEIGSIVKGSGEVVLKGKLSWEQPEQT